MSSQQAQTVQQSLQQKLCFNGAQALLDTLLELGVDTILDIQAVRFYRSMMQFMRNRVFVIF